MEKVPIICVVIFLFALAILRLTNGAIGGFSDSGSWDFHPFWHHGQFLRFGTQWAYDATGSTAATYTPALNFVLSSLSYLAFEDAKLIWTGLIVLLVLAIPWLIIVSLPVPTSWPARILIALCFYGLTGISIAIRAGQPSVLVVFLIALSFYLSQKKLNLFAGVILGLALSKFSLSVPILLYFLYKRQWSIVITGCVIQFLAVAVLVFVVGGSLTEGVSNYRNQLSTLAGAYHINLIHIAGHFPHRADQFAQLAIILSLLMFGLIWFAVIRYRGRCTSKGLWDFAILSFLNTWGLLVFYVQQYDVGTSIFAISLIISAIFQSHRWNLSSSQKMGVIILASISLFCIISFPGLSYIGFIRPLWAPIRWKLMTVGVAGLMLTTLWLWRQTVNTPNKSR